MLEIYNLATPFEVGFAAAAVVLLILCVILFYRLSAKSRDLAARESTLEERRLRLEEKDGKIAAMAIENEKNNSTITELTGARAALEQNVTGLSYELDGLRAENTGLKGDIEAKQKELATLTSTNATLLAQVEKEQELRGQDKERFETSYKELEQKLTVLGEKMLKERGQALQENSEKEFKQLVTPLKQELTVFREYLQNTQKINSEQAGSLSTELDKLQKAQVSLTDQAEKLAKALTSGGKSQGLGGEQQLERVLEASGLTRGIEYEREVAGSRANGETGRPDAVIRLPDEHCLIIDAKCSLTAYTNLVNAPDEGSRQRALSEHISSVRKHVKELADADYSSYTSLNSPSFVFMFVPIDAALTEALRADSALYDNAVKSRVYLVSPSTLLPALRVVSNLWMLSSQNDRMRALANEAENVYKQYKLVCESYDTAQARIQTFETAFSEVGARLKSGKGNLGRRLENFSSKAPGVVMDLAGKTLRAPKKETQPDAAAAQTALPFPQDGEMTEPPLNRDDAFRVISVTDGTEGNS